MLKKSRMKKVYSMVIVGAFMLLGIAPLPTAMAANGTVQIQTCGVLPVILLNLSPYGVNFSLNNPAFAAVPTSFDPGATWLTATNGVPTYIGMSGVYFNNTPTIPNWSVSTLASHSLSPYFTTASFVEQKELVSQNKAAITATVKINEAKGTMGQLVDKIDSKGAYMNSFACFPSFTGSVNISCAHFLNMGYTPSFTANQNSGAFNSTRADVLAGYPTADGHDVGANQHSDISSGNILSMSKPSTTNIMLDMYSEGSDALVGNLNISINSLGSSSSANPQSQGSLKPLLAALNDIVTVGDAIVSEDPVAIGEAVYGVYGQVRGMSGNANGQNKNSTTSYPESYKGINVFASGQLNGKALALAQATTAQATAYNNNTGNDITSKDISNINAALNSDVCATYNLGDGDDYLILYTWRQAPVGLPAVQNQSADTLVAAVVNQTMVMSSRIIMDVARQADATRDDIKAAINANEHGNPIYRSNIDSDEQQFNENKAALQKEHPETYAATYAVSTDGLALGAVATELNVFLIKMKQSSDPEVKGDWDQLVGMYGMTGTRLITEENTDINILKNRAVAILQKYESQYPKINVFINKAAILKTLAAQGEQIQAANAAQNS